MPYVLLGIAIVLELFGTTFLKASAGFTKLFPTLLTLIFYGACYFFFFQSPEFHQSQCSLCYLVRHWDRGRHFDLGFDF